MTNDNRIEDTLMGSPINRERVNKLTHVIMNAILGGDSEDEPNRRVEIHALETATVAIELLALMLAASRVTETETDRIIVVGEVAAKVGLNINAFKKALAVNGVPWLKTEAPPA